MEKNNSKLTFHKRRGIATIVGTIIFVALFFVILGAATNYLDLQGSKIDSQIIANDQLNLVKHENYTISGTCVDPVNNRLFVEAANNGTNYIQFTDLWIVNSSLTSSPATFYNITHKDSFLPFGSESNVLWDQPLYMNPGTYDIKLVTLLGTIGPTRNLVVPALSDPGVFLDAFVTAGSGGLDSPEGLLFHTDGNLYVASELSHAILKYDGTTGASLGTFADLDPVGTNSDCKKPLGMEFGPDGNLYIASEVDDVICRVDGSTGAFIDNFVTDGLGGLSDPNDLTFGSDGNLYVTSEPGGKVYRYNGSTGAFIDVFTSAGIAFPKFLTFYNGDLYVSSSANDKITQYDGSNGAQKTDFIPNSDTKPDSPEGLLWGSNSNLYVSSESDDRVLEYDSTGAFVKEFVTAASGGLDEPADLTFGPDGNLYVSSEATDEILRYQGFGAVPFVESSSDFSCSDLVVTTLTIPNEPTSVSPTAGDKLVSLTWTVPSDQGGTTITDYIVQYKLSSSGDWLTFADGTGIGTAATVTSLTGGSSYDFQVAAVNSEGTGTYSTLVTSTPYATPDPPTSLGATGGVQQISLSWTAPTYVGTTAITDYIVQYKLTSSGTWLTFPDGTSTSTSAIVTSLADGTSYDFQVAAVNSDGTGTYSTSATASTLSLPSAPTSLAAIAGNSQVSLSWIAPSSGSTPFTDYIIQYKLSSESTWLTFPDGTSTSTSATVTGLTNFSAYDFQVAAVNVVGTGPYSSSVSETPSPTGNPPSEPRNLLAVPGAFEVSLTWDVPTSNGGNVITDYIVEYKLNSAETWSTFDDGVSTTKAATVTSLTANLSYDFRVAAVNIIGTGAYSSTATATPTVQGPTGTPLGDFATGIDGSWGLVYGPDDHLYVASNIDDKIMKFDGTTGAFISDFATGSLNQPAGVAFGPDGHLYVASAFTNNVWKFNGATGGLMGEFISTNLDYPQGLVFGSDGNLYVANKHDDNIWKFDGTTGASLGEFVGTTNINDPGDLTFGSDGHLYVANTANDNVWKFDGTTGASIGVFASGNGLESPWGLDFGPLGNLYVTSHQAHNQDAGGVLKFDGTTGAFISQIVAYGGGGLDEPKGLIFDTSGNFLVSSKDTDIVEKYD